MLTVVPDGCPGRERGKDASPSLVDEIVRLGAPRMGAGALPLLYLHGLSSADYVYLWAVGIDVNIRLDEHKLCLLVMTRVRADGREELIAFADGYRESAGPGPAWSCPPAATIQPGPWVHLRTASPVEPAFATVRHRVTVTQGPGPGAAGLAMAFRLIQAARDHWRMVMAPHLVALVRAA